MKCLMIKPEPLEEILELEKEIEYRTWSTQYRGDIFLGCSATKNSKGFLAAVARIDACIFNRYDQIYQWYLKDIRIIKPIPIKGRLRLFETGIEDYEILSTPEQVEKAYKEAASQLQK